MLVARSSYLPVPLLLASLLAGGGCAARATNALNSAEQYRQDRQQLVQQLADERRVREAQQQQLRDLRERLAESEKQLARLSDQQLAERPGKRPASAASAQPAAPGDFLAEEQDVIVVRPAEEERERGAEAGRSGSSGWRPVRP